MKDRELIEELRSRLENAEMGNGCLAMIRETLEGIGEEMGGTPPMMYNDAICCSVGRRENEITRLRTALTAIAEDGNQIAVNALLQHTKPCPHKKSTGAAP